MTDLLFSPPFWLPVLIGVVGIILFVTGNSGGKTGVRNAGAGVLGFAVLFTVVAYLVDTDVEKVEKLSRQVVVSVEKQDWPTLTGLLTPTCKLTGFGTTFCVNRQNLVEEAKDKSSRYGLTSLAVTSLKATQDQSGIVADLNVFVQGVQTTTSGWRFVWQKDGDVWHLNQIECLSIGNQNGNDAARILGK